MCTAGSESFGCTVKQIQGTWGGGNTHAGTVLCCASARLLRLAGAPAALCGGKAHWGDGRGQDWGSREGSGPVRDWGWQWLPPPNPQHLRQAEQPDMGLLKSDGKTASGGLRSQIAGSRGFSWRMGTNLPLPEEIPAVAMDPIGCRGSNFAFTAPVAPG